MLYAAIAAIAKIQNSAGATRHPPPNTASATATAIGLAMLLGGPAARAACDGEAAGPKALSPWICRHNPSTSSVGPVPGAAGATNGNSGLAPCASISHHGQDERCEGCQWPL